MRSIRVATCLLFSLLAAAVPVSAAPAGSSELARSFEQDLTLEQRLLAQILLIAGGYTNAVPMEHLNGNILKALLKFQSDNDLIPGSRLDETERERLLAAGAPRLAMWGFRKVAYPGRPIAIWAPLGLGLDVKENVTGLHFRDPRGRLSLDMVSLPDKDVTQIFRNWTAKLEHDSWNVHYTFFKSSENWFVISATAADGSDHYYRYHQDGGSVTGFALEWNNAVENINAERIAVIMSGSLRAAMLGAPFADPPVPQAEARATPDTPPAPTASPAPPPPPPEVQPAAVPVAPPPTPPKSKYSSGTGFFVSQDGHLITNAHVVEGCSEIAVKGDDGVDREAERIASDTTNDLALLKVATTPKRIVALRVGARLGEGVEAFGYPHSDLLATSGNFTLGNITALSGLHDDSRYVQISVPVQAGNSGGPLLDASGNLVGVVSAKLDAIKVMLADGDLPQNVNFAVKSAMVANFLDANRVAYKTGAPTATPLQPADLADLARAVSLYVLCK